MSNQYPAVPGSTRPPVGLSGNNMSHQANPPQVSQMAGPHQPMVGQAVQAGQAGQTGQTGQAGQAGQAGKVGKAGGTGSGEASAPRPMMTQKGLDAIVMEYLAKKGYSRTELMLRAESANRVGRAVRKDKDEKGFVKYFRGFDMTKGFVETNLDIYKPELRRLLWPLFVHSFLALIEGCWFDECGTYFDKNKHIFLPEHEDDVRVLSAVRLPEHLPSNNVAQIYLHAKYRVTLSSMAYYSLVSFLETAENGAGTIVISMLQSHCEIKTVERGNLDPHSLAGLMNKARLEMDMPAEDEGIPGHHPGSANTRSDAPANLPKVRLGALPMEPEFRGDVEAELQEQDEKARPVQGQNTLLEEFRAIKQEDSEDGPARTEVPLPKPMARDVAIEVQRVKDNRARFKIETRTGGVGPGLSVCMFTFHNTYDNVNCLEFSGDNLLAAIGTNDSYIRLFSLDGRPLPSFTPAGPDSSATPPSSSRMLIGHSAPVYALSFSPSAPPPTVDHVPSAESPSTSPRYLLSCSGDKTIRLWLLDTCSCLVVYRGHDSPVWDVTWGPYGHYFLSGGHDRSARLWSTDHIAFLRLFAGHDNDVDCVAFHPNSAYVFTGSSDRSVRMWSIVTGEAVRLFTGHTGNITTLACSPNGRTLASADDHGAILLWDLATGRRMKRMRGHAKGGIWSMDWTVEGTCLASGGMDGTVRIWDVGRPADGVNGKVVAEGGAGRSIDLGVSTTGADLLTGVAAPVGATSSSAIHTGAASSTAPSTTAAPTTTAAAAAAAAATATGAAAAVPLENATAAAATVPGVGGKKKNKEVVVSAEQISAFPTKKSAVYKVRVTRQNLVIAGGAYMP